MTKTLQNVLRASTQLLLYLAHLVVNHKKRGVTNRTEVPFHLLAYYYINSYNQIVSEILYTKKLAPIPQMLYAD